MNFKMNKTTKAAIIAAVGKEAAAAAVRTKDNFHLFRSAGVETFPALKGASKETVKFYECKLTGEHYSSPIAAVVFE